MNMNKVCNIYSYKMSESHRNHLPSEIFLLLCSKSASYPLFPKLNIQERLHGLQIKPGQFSSIEECQKDKYVKWKQNSSSLLLYLFEKLGFLLEPDDMWTHVQQQHSSQEGLSLAIANLLIVNRVSLKEKTDTQSANKFYSEFKNWIGKKKSITDVSPNIAVSLQLKPLIGVIQTEILEATLQSIYDMNRLKWCNVMWKERQRAKVGKPFQS